MPTHSFYLNNKDTKRLEDMVARQQKGKSEVVAEIIRENLDTYESLKETDPFLEEYFTCPLTGDACKVKDLPCVEDKTLTCRNSVCQSQLKRRLGIE